MNIKKELLKQKKKALVLMVSAVVGTTSLSGCSSNFDYYCEVDGTITADGMISYDNLKNAKLVHLTNGLAEIDKYIMVLYNNGKYEFEKYYYDIETGITVYSDTIEEYKNFKMEVILDSMVDFLYKYDMVKDEYSIDDVKKLKGLLLEEEQLFKDNLETSSVKVLSRRIKGNIKFND